MATETQMKKATWYCTEGGSDKQYTMWIELQGDGYVVQAQWGPRGGHVQSGQKTPKPVPLDQAEKVYAKVEREKLAKGYHLGEDAPAFSQVEGAQDTGMRPMLLTDFTGEDEEQFLADPAWAGQQKMNGKRILLRVEPSVGVCGGNRRGLRCPIPQELEKSIPLATLQAVFDGELVGDVYHAFDLLEAGGLDLRAETYAERHVTLRKLVATIPMTRGHLRVVDLAVGACDKRELFHKLRRENQEGIVFKKLNGVYVPGKIENQKKAIAVKVKFYAECQAVVIDWTDKQSIEVGLGGRLKGDSMEIISVGKVTVPTKYVKQIEKGKTVRVRYLYATAGKQLYQANLDPTDDGIVKGEMTLADPISVLKYEGKEEE